MARLWWFLVECFVNLFHNFFYSQRLWLSPHKEGFRLGKRIRSKQIKNHKTQCSNKPTQQSWPQLCFWILTDFSEYMKFTGFFPLSSSFTVNSWVTIFTFLLSLQEWGRSQAPLKNIDCSQKLCSYPDFRCNLFTTSSAVSKHKAGADKAPVCP